MKIGIMQPYFLPYLGYFSLIKATDFWVVFDEVQFIRHGWVERNRVLNSSDGWQYIKVPLVKAPRETKIKDTKIRNEDWTSKILAQLTCYKRKAPYYNDVIDLLNRIFQMDTDDITTLNTAALKEICSYLGLPFNYRVFSQSGIVIEGDISPGEWALNISRHFKADEYINPYGGEEIFDKQQYAGAGIKIRFLQNNLTPYNQRRVSLNPDFRLLMY